MTHRGPFQPRTFCDSVISERTENVLYIDACVLLAAYSCSGVWDFNRKGEVNNEVRNLCIVVMGYYPSS